MKEIQTLTVRAAATQAKEIRRPAAQKGSGGDADEAGPEATHDGDDAQSVARKVASDVEEMKSWPY